VSKEYGDVSISQEKDRLPDHLGVRWALASERYGKDQV
jgi:hypothetical protein